MTRILPLLLLSLAPIAVFAQQLSLFTQYRENATLINPAAIEGDYFAYGQNVTFSVFLSVAMGRFGKRPAHPNPPGFI